MAPVVPDPARIHAFHDWKAFDAWLAGHHDSEPEVWIRIFKKASGVATISPTEAIDVALCWGWIDGIRKGLDETAFLQRYTPRGRKSIWSQVNRENVARLTAEGRMTEHGQKHVDAARADGRWDAAYAAGSKMETPADLMAAIEADPKALATYKTLTSQNRFALAFRVGNLKTAAGREKKIKAFVAMLARGETIYPQKPKKDAS
jgi:uncharacterized protein YdeI (YjbR/CyaY-like superfamily)